MRLLMALLLFGVVFSIVSAITGIQSVHGDTRTDTVITYWHGYGRLFALGYAAVWRWHSTAFIGGILSFGSSALRCYI
jgi:hypothetical protein